MVKVLLYAMRLKSSSCSILEKEAQSVNFRTCEDQMENQKLWDVVVVEDATGFVVSVIGKDLNDRAMERRIETGMMRINMDAFHVKEVPAGDGERLLAKAQQGAVK